MLKFYYRFFSKLLLTGISYLGGFLYGNVFSVAFWLYPNSFSPPQFKNLWRDWRQWSSGAAHEGGILLPLWIVPQQQPRCTEQDSRRAPAPELRLPRAPGPSGGQLAAWLLRGLAAAPGPAPAARCSPSLVVRNSHGITKRGLQKTIDDK